MPAIPQTDRIGIIDLASSGMSYGNIGEATGISKATVGRIVKRWRDEGSIDRSRNPGSRGNRVSTPADDNAMLEILRNEPFANAKMALRISNFPGSLTTARRRINTSELNNRVAARKPALKQEHREARMAFALQYFMEGPAFWSNVVFTDEKQFKASRSSKIRVYRPRNTRYNERYVAAKNIANFGVNLWGWISAESPGLIVNIEDRLNTEHYIQILQNVMIPSVGPQYPHGGFTFQQDNCPVHTARAVRDWFEVHGITVMDWPSRSPDLNPIENLWGILVRIIDQRRLVLENKEQLLAAITDAWHSVPGDYHRRVCSSMPRRLNAVIAANGGYTKY